MTEGKTYVTELDVGHREREPVDKQRLELLPYRPLCRIGERLDHGTQKYHIFNWEKGLPVDSCIRRLLHHVYKYLDGDRTEDHLAAAGCNLLFAMEHEGKPEWTQNLRKARVHANT